MLFVLVFYCSVKFLLIFGMSDFLHCHMDPAFHPREGMMEEIDFKWLAALQYINIQTGTPHYFRVPRVVLITRMYVLSTAVDAAAVPDGYALGNVVFPDYERDETECGIEKGAELCAPGILYMPIEDVLLHPEYKNFGAVNSVALLKLLISVQSKFVVPVCLPLLDYVVRTQISDPTQPEPLYYHIDFIRPVPRDFTHEEKEVTFIRILSRDICSYDENSKIESQPDDRVVCSTECGFKSGSPTVVHEATGYWTLVSLAQGGTACIDPLVTSHRQQPNTHILIHPYVTWITRAITGVQMSDIDPNDPFGFAAQRVGSNLRASKHVSEQWTGRWWMGGVNCYNRGSLAMEMFRFYHEVFQARPKYKTNITYFLEIDSATKATIVCVKVGMDQARGDPYLWGLETNSVKLWLPMRWITSPYRFEVEAWGRNVSEGDDFSHIAIGQTRGEDNP